MDISRIRLQFSEMAHDPGLWTLDFGLWTLLPNPLSPSFEGFVHDLSHLRDLIDAHERIDFGQQLRQFFAKTLRQASRNDQPLAAVFCLPQFSRLQDRINAFLLGG